MKDMLLEMGQCVLDSGRILAGLAILEDGFDETAKLRDSTGRNSKAQIELLKHHRTYFRDCRLTI